MNCVIAVQQDTPASARDGRSTDAHPQPQEGVGERGRWLSNAKKSHVELEQTVSDITVETLDPKHRESIYSHLCSCDQISLLVENMSFAVVRNIHLDVGARLNAATSMECVNVIDDIAVCAAHYDEHQGTGRTKAPTPCQSRAVFVRPRAGSASLQSCHNDMACR